ncbi:hypothetical protein [Photobacterium leiognathi]|uniref:hypothetical protein n=1 Tax=Photobacterium leiognathi TaxID=553611 RepID=UPI0029818F2F|nr:hypothetical protein [Photobacterium leiognathi]
MELIFNPIQNKSTSVEIAENELLIKLLKQFRSNGVINHKTILELEAIDDLPQTNNVEIKKYKEELKALLMRCSELHIKQREEKASQVDVEIQQPVQKDSANEVNGAEPIKLMF